MVREGKTLKICYKVPKRVDPISETLVPCLGYHKRVIQSTKE